MGKSIFEEYCEKVQPDLLNATSNMSLAQAENFVKDCISKYSFGYAAGYILGLQLIFAEQKDKEAYSKKTILEIITELRVLHENGLCNELFDGYVECIAKVFGFSMEEVLRLLKGEKYWLSYGHDVKKN